MAGKRKNHTAALKIQVALAAIKGVRTVDEMAGQFRAHPTLSHAWKKQLLGGAEVVFADVVILGLGWSGPVPSSGCYQALSLRRGWETSRPVLSLGMIANSDTAVARA